MSAVDGRFDPEGFLDLMPAVYLMDEPSVGQIVEWMRLEVTNRQAAYQLVLCLADSCAGILKMRGRSGAALVIAPGATSAMQTFGRILTAAVNDDAAMKLALTTALLDHIEAVGDPDEYVKVIVELFGLLSFLMQQVVARTEGGEQS